VVEREGLVSGFVETGGVAPFVELVQSGEIVEGDVGVVFNAVVQESVALEALFRVEPSFGIDV
jgi:hypothetical protein